jgi:hypothetical protein
MNESRLPDYLEHIRQAATDACSFVEGQSKKTSLPTGALNKPSF